MTAPDPHNVNKKGQENKFYFFSEKIGYRYIVIFLKKGRSDWVTCFQCGIYLGRWSPNEKPWEEHAFWSPDCQYLQLVQGTDFASEVSIDIFNLFVKM